MNDETQTTLRDEIANAVETVSTENVETKVQQEETKQETRERDEQGRFSKSEQEVNVEIQPGKPKLQRPSSWKKEYWGHWDKLTNGQAMTPEEALQLAEYSVQRESDYAKGVSTYKTEYDRVKPMMDALNQIMPLIQQNGMDVNSWLQSVGQAYRGLASGSNQQRIGTLFQLAQMYKIPLEDIFDLADDGRWYLNTQKIQNPQHQPQVDVRQAVREAMMEETATKQVADFVGMREKFPHVGQVKETMAGLLRAGLVDNLESAYKAAIYMPQHAEILESIQSQQREMDEKAKAEEAAKLAQKARSKAVSPKSSTPADNRATEKGKGIRSALEDAFNEHTGRV